MADDKRLNELKGKYSAVLRTIEQQGVRLANVHIENNKLLIRGEAPSQDAKNNVWNSIKQVDPSYSSDLTADITVSANAAAAEGTRSRSEGGAGKSYTVKSGDTLSKIAKEMYGDSNDYMKIFNANKDKLSDPDKIQPGQNLVIPA